MAQTPIVTLTLNPALDMSTSVGTVRAGPKLRCGTPRFDPGGGGINVSRVIARMGGTSIAFAALGGPSGAHLAELLTAEGVNFLALEAPGPTRQSMAVTESTTGKQFRFVMPGPEWTDTRIAASVQAIRNAMPKGALLLVSGSQPPGFPDDFVLTLTKAVEGHAAVLLDTSGAPLFRVAATDGAGLHLLRMNADEAEELAGTPLHTIAETADFAAGLVARGVAKTVIIARGAEGSVLVSPQGRWFCHAADVAIKSKIGAGDSFVAGYILATARGAPPDQALARGVAAASAAIMTEGTELCRVEDAEALIAACPVGPI
ncbi:1-phosphofructokinase family hexose kinase [Oceaniglobus ichthyenteri]|uniref:1-phosphofructokinase family hexose kinase n=1 Tax=Oceaniglobus ichthyenteri TaxID=2136177 RepID=UPI000D3CAB2D|nr:hexose kinase [Oceaniglobus ichthyenteri]